MVNSVCVCVGGGRSVKIYVSESGKALSFPLMSNFKYNNIFVYFRGAFLINRKLMQVIREQNMREKHDLERVQRKLDKIAQHQKEAGKNTANINEHYICKCLIFSSTTHSHSVLK